MGLTEEVPKQLFRYYDKNGKGYISGDEFAELINNFGYGKMTDCEFLVNKDLGEWVRELKTDC